MVCPIGYVLPSSISFRTPCYSLYHVYEAREVGKLNFTTDLNDIQIWWLYCDLWDYVTLCGFMPSFMLYVGIYGFKPKFLGLCHHLWVSVIISEFMSSFQDLRFVLFPVFMSSFVSLCCNSWVCVLICGFMSSVVRFCHFSAYTVVCGFIQ